MPEPTPTDWSTGRYECVAERIATIASEVVAAVDRRQPLHDTAVLDLACGTGNAALAAATAGARVTGVDLTADLIEIAMGRPGADAVQWVVADAADTGLPAAAFAAVVSNMGIIFVEPARLVDEVARVLKPGGIFGFSAWVRDGVGSPFSTPIIETLGPPQGLSHSPDQWGDSDMVRERLSAAFTDVDIDTARYTWTFGSVTDAMYFLEHESPMHVDLLGRISATQRSQLLAAFQTALSAHADHTGQVSFSSPYLIATATRTH
ncbi:methyltransferase domain-containing protein [Mycobacterium sp. TNTM28]|uniref:Methyltransferase domain-containing protein n=1 Tax=[Mycobacterium] fortunisiensis TaxID=2600579 RepID=A0ABS6KKH1_9MYCO|nr:class I SAM-dependent methyltransferase [[Mycobacterium] fortunisiensis]MBU9764069.1 methyltransferase domain-containing protein [[Mycobacterium] fortunisiensis]